MTIATELLTKLRTLGVQLTLDGDTLKLNAPKGSLTPSLQAELRDNKQDLLALLRSMKKSEMFTASLPMTRVERKPLMPLSFAQQRLWFLQQMDPVSTAYNLLAVMRLQGDLNPDILEQSLKNILLRHEALRTVFVQVDGTPYTCIVDGQDWMMERLLLDRQPGQSIEDSIAQFTEIKAAHPFDLERGPLLKGYLLRDSEQDNVLVLFVHHIISDGWSMGVAVTELAENYRALLSDQIPNLPPLTLQYIDYTDWQRRWFDTGVNAQQTEYWHKQLDGAPATTIFPRDHDPLEVGDPRGRRSKLILTANLVRRIEAFSRQHDSTLFMTLLSAFMLLLSRYSGQKDVVVGSPSANRGRAELNGLIGFFVNNLVLRASVDDGLTFLQLLARVRETTLGAFEHQDIPFDQLVREIQSDRNPDHSPFFQTMFILQNFPLQELELPHLKVTPLEIDAQTARYDLTVEVYPRKDELYAFFDFRTDLYDEATIHDIQLGFEYLLEQVVDNPLALVESYSLLPPERQKMILQWHNPAPQSTEPKPGLLPAIDVFATATPNKIAVRSADFTLTYAELALATDRLARQLRSTGVTQGSLVPVLLSRSPHLLVALVGILKAGGTYVPLDPIYPQQRIATILESVKPPLILTEQALLTTVEGYKDQCILLENLDWSGTYEGANVDSFDWRKVSGQDLAYVIFTSGSTGKPKGVEISHGALGNFLSSMQRAPGLGSSDRLLAVTTVSFDIAGLELFLPIYSGGEVIISVSPGNLPLLLDEIKRERPTILQATPALWQMLLSSGWDGDPQLTALCGGEALTVDLVNLLQPRVKALWNMYGPTETTIWSSALKLDAISGKTVPLGGPIDNTSFYVLDPLRQPVPVGVAGELYIGGHGLARGYLNQPDLTADRFVTNAFNGGTRLYRTGDLVRRRRDDLIEFIGRADFQVKLRGFRIELGEIEHALRQQAEVYESVVLLREDSGEKELVAYLVFIRGQSIPYSLLRDRLRQRLPDYMIPAQAVELTSLPRLPNGKLDRGRLPVPQRSMLEIIKPADRSHLTATESIIARILSSLLNTENFNTSQRFFEFGAHSLLIVRAHARVRQELDSALPLVSFFQYPTISALAAHIDLRLATEREGDYAVRD